MSENYVKLFYSKTKSVGDLRFPAPRTISLDDVVANYLFFNIFGFIKTTDPEVKNKAACAKSQRE